MKRSLLLTVVVATAMVAVAIFGIRSMNGSADVASADVGTGTAHLELDMLKDGDVWCDPVDAYADTIIGSDYQVAICLSDSTAAPAAFNFELTYDDTLNTCAEVTCPELFPGSGIYTCLDDNPDANSGDTTFNATELGSGWDCNGADIPDSEPQCDTDAATGAGNGRAMMSCYSTAVPALVVGAGVSTPIAVINFHADAGGLDQLMLENVAMGDEFAATILECYGSGPCYGADDNKGTGPTPTPEPPACDIADMGMVPSVASITMKVGDPPTVFTATETVQNLGGTTGQACQVGFMWGAAIYTEDPEVQLPIPAGLDVRLEPYGSPMYDGDICIACTDPADPVTVCALTGEYTYVSCDEQGLSAFVVSLNNGSCENGVDDNVPADGFCDWDGFSASCTPAAEPDPNCLSVNGLLLNALNNPVMAVDDEIITTREVKVSCVERGVYPLLVVASSYGARDEGAEYPGAENRDPNPANDISFTVVPVTCTKGPEMVKDCDTDEPGIQTNCNLWLMDPAFAGKTTPEELPAADGNGCVIAEEGKGCLAVDVWLKSADDEDDPNDSDLIPECLGAWEHQIRFDHKILKFANELDPVGWLESEGRIANCTISILAENWILEGCVSKDDPETEGMQLGPCGDGIIEKMLIIPQTNDLIYRGVFRPTKDNGVVTNIVDDNCEITDIYAEPMADTLPGGLTPICGDLHITVRMLEGDIDLDCDVDVVDDQALAMRYGSSWGLQLYDQWFDLEPKFADQDIDIKDLQFVFGRNYSTCQVPIPDDQAIPVDPGQP